MYCTWDNGADVFYRVSYDAGQIWSSAVTLDYTAANTARDPYITHRGSNVFVSWKELNATSGKWYQVVAFSANHGQTWPTKYKDESATWSSYECHLITTSNRLWGTYVSDYEGRNEVYVRRWTFPAAAVEYTGCASDNTDSTAASQPCIELTDNNNVSAYYQYGATAPRPIYQSYTTNGGTSWTLAERIGTQGGTYDMNYPEVTRFMSDSSRVFLVCDATLWGGAYPHKIWGTRYASGWAVPLQIQDGLDGWWMYPQIAARGDYLFIAYRGAASGDPAGGKGKFNGQYGEQDKWSDINGLFYNCSPYDTAGCIDVCANTTRFFSAEAGTGTRNQTMVKREDSTDPTVAITDPGQYHNNMSFNVTATITDDWNVSNSWLLSPTSEAYQGGVLHAEFSYSLHGAGVWSAFPGGSLKADSPWTMSFNPATIAEGHYDLKVHATDTAGRTGDAIYSDLIIDKTAPTADLSPSGGEKVAGSSWYRVAPKLMANCIDTLSGVDLASREYKVDSGGWAAYPTTPVEGIDPQEGAHMYYIRCSDKAGNQFTDTTGVQIKVDTQAPTAQATMPAADGNNGWYKSNTAATVTITATDVAGGSGVASILYAWDGSPTTSYSAPIIAPEGYHTLYYQAKDNAGNLGDIETLGIMKDTTPPTIFISSPTSDQWIDGMVTIQTMPNDNLGIGAVDFYLNGELFDHRTSPPWNGFLDTTAWSNQYYDLEVVVEDLAGNRNAVTTQVTVFVSNGLSKTNYFAEGTTRVGFDTWLCLQNPNDETVDATVNYMLGPGQGNGGATNYSLAPHSRSTIPVRSDPSVGDDKDVSIEVTCNRPIISERPMYFEYTGTGNLAPIYGNHTAQGTQVPTKEWYLAEGCTRSGFEEWICIQNPSDDTAHVQVNYMLGTGDVIVRDYTVERWQRYTILVNQEIGPEQDVSLKVTSDQDIVVERPMYFWYQDSWDGGHNTMAVPAPGLEWYFAEGCTRNGFNEWLTIMNPGDEKATVNIVYMTEDVASQVEKTYAVAPHARYTVNVNEDVARGHDVSCKLTSDKPVVAERPMYFFYDNVGGGIDEGSCATGCSRAQATFYMAEGCTREGFIEYICIQNPGDNLAEVSIMYMLEDGSTIEQLVKISPHTRVTVTANDAVGPEHDVSVRITSSEPMIVERPMYAFYKGEYGAADTLAGYTFDR